MKSKAKKPTKKPVNKSKLGDRKITIKFLIKRQACYVGYGPGQEAYWNPLAKKLAKLGSVTLRQALNSRQVPVGDKLWLLARVSERARDVVTQTTRDHCWGFGAGTDTQILRRARKLLGV